MGDEAIGGQAEDAIHVREMGRAAAMDHSAGSYWQLLAAEGSQAIFRAGATQLAGQLLEWAFQADWMDILISGRSRPAFAGLSGIGLDGGTLIVAGFARRALFLGRRRVLLRQPEARHRDQGGGRE